jgi:hypothetical protein
MNSQKPFVAPVTSPAIETVGGVLLDLKAMIEAGDLDGMEACRADLIKEVMSEGQRLASSWSMIDGPFAAQHTKDDHELVEMEFQALIARVVHLPDSVEGIRYLERWLNTRLKQLDEVQEHVKAGTELQFKGAEGNDQSVVLNEDMAKGMRMALVVARSVFEKFPITMDVSPDLEREDG